MRASKVLSQPAATNRLGPRPWVPGPALSDRPGMTVDRSIPERHSVLARFRAADQNAALMIHPDRLAAAERHLSDVDFVAAARQIGNDRFGNARLDPQLAAKREAARHVRRLLRIEAAIEHVVDDM